MKRGSENRNFGNYFLSYFYKTTMQTYVFEDAEHNERNNFDQIAKLGGQKFDFRLRYQISIALDYHLKVSSLFFIAILSLYSLQFFSLELSISPPELISLLLL